jgi:hypothetical protein
MVTQFHNAASAGDAGSASVQPSRQTREYGVYQVKITGVATIKVQGSNNNVDWVDIKSYSASGGDVVSLFAFMRSTITAYTSGAVSDWLQD